MLQALLVKLASALWGLPLLCFIVGVGVAATVMLRFVQFTQFFKSWRLIFGGSEQKTAGEINPLQAFMNALSAGMGNGSLAGVATAVHAGGPGAVFWIFIVGFIAMIFRFAEVYLAILFPSAVAQGSVLGGPFIYLGKVRGGSFLPYVYAVCCLLYAFMAGSAMQCNSINTAVGTIIPVSSWVVGLILVAFVLYVLLGGAQRISAVSVVLVPLKVILFFISSIIIYIYLWDAIVPTFHLVMEAAFHPAALAGGALGITVQKVFCESLSRAVNASEAGLGTAAVIYGSTGSKKPFDDACSAMIGTFISVNLVCVMMAFTLVLTGAWTSGATGSALSSLAFQSVFGLAGGYIISLLAVLFGVGVFVAYGFIGRQCWLFLTNNRFEHGFTFLFCCSGFAGALGDTSAVWAGVNVVVAACVIVNLYGILCLLPGIRTHSAANK